MGYRFFNEKWSDAMKAQIASLSDSDYNEFMKEMGATSSNQQQRPTEVSEEFKLAMALKKEENEVSAGVKRYVETLNQNKQTN